MARCLGMRICKSTVLVLIIIFSLKLNGQNPSSTSTITLKEVTLKVTKTKTSKSKIPFSLTTLKLTQYQGFFQQLSLKEYLVSVPGLFALNSNNYAQDLRISVRGFGARAAFGIRGIKIIIDGIPETTPDGQGQLDNLPLGLLSSLEVIRGPSASLYGNASGGVIYLNTLDQLENQTLEFKSSFGAYGFRSYQLTTSFEGDKTKGLIYANRIQTNGFRNFSGFNQNLLNAKINHRFSSNSALELQLNYTNSPEAKDAGGLTFDEAQADWTQARKRNVDYDTFEKVEQFKFGVSWKLDLGPDLNLDTYGFYSFRNFYGKLPFENGGIIDLNRNYYGLGSRLNFEKQKHRWQIGFETAQQFDQRDRYLNLLGIEGELSFSQLEKFGSFGVYILDEIELKKFLFRSSLRYDDLVLGANTVMKDQHYQVLNPSLGLSYELFPKHNLFANFSSSFETPALSELSANPYGGEGLNLELNPSRALNYEFGYKALFSKAIIEANFFFIQSSNEILPYELEAFPGRSFYRNTGATERLGIEVFTSYKWKAWHLQASITQAQYKFSESESYQGNSLPGIPGSQLTFQFGYQSLNNWQMQITGEHIGRFYANNSNSVEVDEFQKFRIQGRKLIKMGDVEINFFAGINNIFNVKYFDNVRLNAFGQRYYEPAPGRNTYFGLSIGI